MSGRHSKRAGDASGDFDSFDSFDDFDGFGSSAEFDMTAFEVLEEALASAQAETMRAIKHSEVTRSAVPLTSHRRSTPTSGAAARSGGLGLGSGAAARSGGSGAGAAARSGGARGGMRGGARGGAHVGAGAAGRGVARGPASWGAGVGLGSGAGAAAHATGAGPAVGAHTGASNAAAGGARVGAHAASDASNVDDILEQLLHAARGSRSQDEADKTAEAADDFSETPEELSVFDALVAAAASDAAVSAADATSAADASVSAIKVPASPPLPVAPLPPVAAPAVIASEAPAIEPPRSLREYFPEEEESSTPSAEVKPVSRPSVEWGPREVQGEVTPEAPSLFLPETTRRRHIWPIFICAAAVFIIATGLLTYFNRSLLAVQAEHHSVIQREGNAYLDESIALIQEADSVIVSLDRATESQIAEEDIPRLEALLDKTDSVQESLDDAINKAVQAKETFLEDESQQLAQYAQDAAEYRKRMLEISGEIVRYDIAAMRSALALEYAWTLIIDADANMRSAVETVAEGGAGAVTESRDYNQEAVNKLVLADEALDKAVEAFSTVDVGALRAYLEAKKASAELALASDEAFLEGSYYTANLRNEEFIEKDAEAVTLAAAIPGDLLSLVVTAYEQAIGSFREEYVAARSRATDVDAYLRAYLGVDVLLETEPEPPPESTE